MNKSTTERINEAKEWNSLLQEVAPSIPFHFFLTIGLGYFDLKRSLIDSGNNPSLLKWFKRVESQTLKIIKEVNISDIRRVSFNQDDYCISIIFENSEGMDEQVFLQKSKVLHVGEFDLENRVFIRDLDLIEALIVGVGAEEPAPAAC